MATPTYSKAPQYVITAINPRTGAVASESFVDGDYRFYNAGVLNDEAKMNDYIRGYVLRDYAVVATQTKLNDMGKVDYQLVIAIHPESIWCDCRKGILCPLNTQQVNFYKGSTTRTVEAK